MKAKTGLFAIANKPLMLLGVLLVGLPFGRSNCPCPEDYPTCHGSSDDWPGWCENENAWMNWFYPYDYCTSGSDCVGCGQGLDSSNGGSPCTSSYMASPPPLPPSMPKLYSSSLLVVSNITGLDTSTYFACRIREVGAASWSTSFVWWSVADAFVSGGSSVDISNGFAFTPLEGWSSSWVNFEVAHHVTVELEVQKLHGDATIALAIPRPAHRANASVSGGKAYITMTGPQQVNIDIDGTLEREDTGSGLMFSDRVGARHTFTIFGNPMLSDAERPDPTSADVLTVSPGETPPTDFNETMLYFLPGVHNLSAIPTCCSTRTLADACPCSTDSTQAGYVAPYKLKSYKQYYVPTEAWLEGGFKSYGDGPVWGANPDTGYGIDSMKIFGYGTVSGINEYWKSEADINANTVPKGMWLRAATNCTVMGLMFVDYNMHILLLYGGGTEDQRNTITHYKALSWRTNGDGLHLFGHWNDVTDLFLRTADDSLYIGDEGSATTYRRIVTWNDANGAPFLFGTGNAGPTTLEDSDVIYHRKQWPYWCGSVFNLRWESGLKTINNYTIRDIRITDPYPTCPLLGIEGSMRNVYMKNVVMDAHSAMSTLSSWYCGLSETNSRFRFGLSMDSGCNLPYMGSRTASWAMAASTISATPAISTSISTSQTSCLKASPSTAPTWASCTTLRARSATQATSSTSTSSGLLPWPLRRCHPTRPTRRLYLRRHRRHHRRLHPHRLHRHRHRPHHRHLRLLRCHRRHDHHNRHLRLLPRHRRRHRHLRLLPSHRRQHLQACHLLRCRLHHLFLTPPIGCTI